MLEFNSERERTTATTAINIFCCCWRWLLWSHEHTHTHSAECRIKQTRCRRRWMWITSENKIMRTFNPVISNVVSSYALVCVGVWVTCTSGIELQLKALHCLRKVQTIGFRRSLYFSELTNDRWIYRTRRTGIILGQPEPSKVQSIQVQL